MSGSYPATPKDVLRALRPVAVPVVIFASVTNLAVLVSPLFMMHVLDRVVPSGNMATLALLGLLAAGALMTNAVVEFLRDRILTRSAVWFEPAAAAAVLPMGAQNRTDRLRDISTIRDFLRSGAGTAADLPWLPFFVLAIALIHPLFLVILIAGVGLLAGVKALGQSLAKTAEDRAGQAREASLSTLRALEREGPLADMMSIGRNLGQRYQQLLGQVADATVTATRPDHAAGAVGRMVRLGVQLSTLSLGAYLVTQSALSAGGMIGASIIVAKTVGILEASLGLIPQALQVRHAAQNLSRMDQGAGAFQTAIHDLSGAVTVQGLTYPRGGGAAPRLERVSLKIAPGECLAILGESGSGKSTLLTAMCGADAAPIGNVFLDETDVRTLDESTRSTQIGYLPQRAQFLAGSIAENIACFDDARDDQKVIAAARLAGVHGLISALPRAYETDLGADPFALSDGQKQRVALARAIYQRPRYLFLDEPNALLDHLGERQLGDAIARLKAAGTTVVMTVHRMAIVNLADKAAVLERGRLIDFGPRADIVGRLANSHRKLQLAAVRTDVQDLIDWVHGQFVRDGDEDFRRRASVVATELWNFARDNGPIKADRILSFEFQFINDTTCAILLSEPRKTRLEAKVSKVRGAIAKDDRSDANDPDPLAADEAALATVIRLSDRFEHRAKDGNSAFKVEIADRSNLSQVAS